MSISTHTPPFPSRSTVIQRLSALAEGSLTREEAAAWAQHWLIADLEPRMMKVSDLAAWEAVKNIAAADMVTTDRPFLYEQADFAAWSEELRNAPE
jgi:hypothetical protein